MTHGADQSEVFYFTDGLETFGPFDRSTMLKRAAERLITEETLIFVEGTTEWTPFGRSGLAGADEKPPPPPLPSGAPPKGNISSGVFAQKAVHARQTVTKQGARLGQAIGGLSGKVVGDITHLRMQLLLPLFEIRSLGWLKDKTILGMVVVGLWPLICIQLIGRDLEATYWAIAFYFSAVWALYFYGAFAPEQVTQQKTLTCFFGTGMVSIPLLLYFHDIPPFGFLLGLTDSHAFPTQLFGMFVAVAVPEEICKALVLVLLLKFSKEPLKPKTLLFYGLMSGLGFGIYEGVSYQTGQNFRFSDTAAQYYLLNLMRLTSLPFLHAIWTGIAGYFLAFSALFPARKHGLMVVAILIPACFHALHNTLQGFIGLAVDTVGVITLLIYLSKSSEIEAVLTATATAEQLSAART
jgi:protease PrsW